MMRVRKRNPNERIKERLCVNTGPSTRHHRCQ
jgi:hypothetical protein